MDAAALACQRQRRAQHARRGAIRPLWLQVASAGRCGARPGPAGAPGGRTNFNEGRACSAAASACTCLPSDGAPFRGILVGAAGSASVSAVLRYGLMCSLRVTLESGPAPPAGPAGLVRTKRGPFGHTYPKPLSPWPGRATVARSLAGCISLIHALCGTLSTVLSTFSTASQHRSNLNCQCTVPVTLIHGPRFRQSAIMMPVPA